jgi:hypothetical protein
MITIKDVLKIFPGAKVVKVVSIGTKDRDEKKEENG